MDTILRVNLPKLEHPTVQRFATAPTICAPSWGVGSLDIKIKTFNYPRNISVASETGYQSLSSALLQHRDTRKRTTP